MSEIADAAVDDLTPESGHRCVACGTDRELDRPNALVYQGSVFGEVICSDCLRASAERARLH